jgi:hypothetical protein
VLNMKILILSLHSIIILHKINIKLKKNTCIFNLIQLPIKIKNHFYLFNLSKSINLKSGFSYSTLEKQLPIYNLFMKSSFKILKSNTFFLRKKCFIPMKTKTYLKKMNKKNSLMKIYEKWWNWSNKILENKYFLYLIFKMTSFIELFINKLYIGNCFSSVEYENPDFKFAQYNNTS